MVGGGTIIRVNNDLGGHVFIETEPHEWGFIAGGDDLVVFDITDNEIIHKYNNVRYIPFSMIISSSYIHTNEINIGEDGFMLGMFADHYGEARNLIAARFGNISLMADESAPIRQPNKSVRPSFLFHLRSRPGFSGSPVFVYRTPAGDLRYASERGKDEIERISRRAEHDRLSRDPHWARRLHDEDDHAEQMDHIHENTFLMQSIYDRRYAVCPLPVP
jgi:hypothetical protein